MRVVSGIARGRLLRAPAGRGTRPTSDRVREALFSMLSSMDAIVGARVLDLFAGSGALGIEALSRGAASATFVDSDRSAVDAIAANLTVLRSGVPGPVTTPESRVVRADALAFAAQAAPVDLVLADPPYEFDRWTDLMGHLTGRTRLLVAEGGPQLSNGWDVSPAWETVKVKRYGGTVVLVARTLPLFDAPVD